MTCEHPESEQQFRVVVDAIVGGPFDLCCQETISEADLKEWKDSLLRLGAIEPVEEESPEHR